MIHTDITVMPHVDIEFMRYGFMPCGLQIQKAHLEAFIADERDMWSLIETTDYRHRLSRWPWGVIYYIRAQLELTAVATWHNLYIG